MTENDLKPDETIFRFLFMSPTWFVGECSDTSFWLTPGFPSFGQRGRSVFEVRGPHRKSHFVLSVRVAPRDENSIVLPNYQWVGEDTSALLGAYYGKLIFNLGQTQSGILTVPVHFDRPIVCWQKSAFNDRPRLPGGPELNLFRARSLLSAFFSASQDDQILALILRAAEFYRLALENFSERPEIAFAVLISTLEALVDIKSYNDAELYDSILLDDLEQKIVMS